MTIPLTDQNSTPLSAKALPICPKCKKRMQSRIARGKFVKTFLFWLPIKRYKCIFCEHKKYVIGR